MSVSMAALDAKLVWPRQCQSLSGKQIENVQGCACKWLQLIIDHSEHQLLLIQALPGNREVQGSIKFNLCSNMTSVCGSSGCECIFDGILTLACDLCNCGIVDAACLAPLSHIDELLPYGSGSFAGLRRNHGCATSKFTECC